VSNADGKTYLSLAQIGSRLGITKQAVHKCANRNSLAKNAAGKVALEDVTAALRSEQSERTQSSKTAETNAVLRQKQLLIKIEQAEHELAETKGRLVSVADVRRELAKIITNAKAVLLSLPSSLAPQVVGLSVPDAEKLLREKIHEGLNQLAEGKYAITPQQG
jgi:hypothetical protein